MKKRVWKMSVKLCALALFTGLQCAVMDASAQQKISVEADSVTYLELFNQIRRQTGLTVVYSNNELDKNKKVAARFVAEDVRQVMDKVLKGTGLGYDLENELVVIKKLQQDKKRETVRLMGRVVDSHQIPLPGITVLLKGANSIRSVFRGMSLGTATDAQGRFAFSIPQMEDIVLQFSFVGMETQEVRYTGQDSMLVVMREAVQEMEEVVVTTGYQNINRRDMVGSYSMVKADDIKIGGVSNVTDMLQGQIAGMVVTRSSGRAGASPKIKIRGTTTLGNTDPLFVVDGIIQDDPIRFNASVGTIDDMENIIGNQISWLNPSDIETVTVLKDASATAIYGSRASNGVIVVTTKKPKQGDRLAVNYSGSVSISPRPTYDRFNLMNSQERLHFSEEAYDAGAKYALEPFAEMNTFEGVMNLFLQGKMTESAYLQRRAYLETLNTDWLELLTRTAVTHTHNVSVGGASDRVNYVVSMGYNKDEGLEKGNDSERFTARTSVNMRLRENIRLAMNINATIGKNKGYANGVDPLNYATSTSRAIPAFEEDGERAYYQRASSYKYNRENKHLSYNIFDEMENSRSTVKNGRVSVGLDFSWNLLDGLTYQFTGGYSYNGVNSDRYSTERTYYVANTYRGYDYGTVDASDPWYKAAQLPNGGELFTSFATQHSYNIQNKLLYQKIFNSDHRLNVMLGTEVRSSINRNTQTTFWGYVPDRGHLFVKPTIPQNIRPVGATLLPEGFDILNALYEGRASIAQRTDNFFSLFATLAYSLKSRYVFNISFRNDASNRFGQDANSHFDPTYSFGMSWRVSEESWMQSLQSVFTNLNLKATYGIQGNANLSKSPDLILRMQGINEVFNSYYSNIVSIPNPNLSWERTHSWDWGLDIRLFDRVNVVLDYYSRKSNAVISQSIPYLNGKSEMDINGGILYNRGYEVTVSFNPVNKKDFGLNVSINASKNNNKGGETPFEATYSNYLTGISTSVLKKGYPVSGFWSYSFAGLDPENGAPLFNNMDVDKETAKSDPTTVLVYSGSSEPDFTGGLNLGIRYKSVTLSSSFALLLGGYKRLSNPYSKFSNGVRLPEASVNLSRELLKRWQKPGDEKHTDIPALLTGGYTMETPFEGAANIITALYKNSDALVVSSSFLRCRNLSLNWQMSKTLTERLRLSSFHVSASVSNLFVVASKRYHGFDPELTESVMPKSYTLSLSVGF